jgi:hypothetical protein
MRGILLALLVLFAAPAQALNFEQVLIDTGLRLGEPARVATLDGKPHLLVVGTDAQGEQQLRIYGLQHGAEASLQLSLELGSELLFMDVARVPGGEALCFLDPKGVVCLDFSSGTLRRAQMVSSLFRLPRSSSIVSSDFMQDLNGDDLDDILVADFSGLQVSIQAANGDFSSPLALSAEPEMNLSENSVRYRSPRTLVADANFDGHDDVLMVEDRSLRVFPGNAAGGFDAEAVVLPLELDLPSRAQLREWDNDRGDIDQSNLSIRRIDRIADLNGDGVADLLTTATHSRGVFDKSSDFAIHLGRNNEGWVSYSREPDSTLVSEGMQFDLLVEDLDGDGRKDLVVPSVRLGLGRVIKALFSGTMTMDLGFYRSDDQGFYTGKPNFSASSKLRIDLKKGQTDVPAILAADFDGDGVKDLLVQQSREELKITLGDGSEDLFGGASHRVTTLLPRNGDRIQPLDVDGNGLNDLVIQYRGSDGEDLEGKIRVMLAL